MKENQGTGHKANVLYTIRAGSTDGGGGCADAMDIQAPEADNKGAVVQSSAPTIAYRR